MKREGRRGGEGRSREGRGGKRRLVFSSARDRPPPRGSGLSRTRAAGAEGGRLRGRCCGEAERHPHYSVRRAGMKLSGKEL